jgi:hypothetical protein
LHHADEHVAEHGKSDSFLYPTGEIMAVTSITAALVALRKLSAENGNTPVEHTGGIIEGWEKMRKEEQLTPEEKKQANEAKSMIAELFGADPSAELDPREVAAHCGMPDKQGARSFVRHQLRLLRLSYNGNGRKAAAD